MGLGILALVVVVLGFLIDPIVTWRTRVVLRDMEGMRGTFDDVSVSPLDLSYEIWGLSIQKVLADGKGVPYLDVERARFGLYWKELVKRHLVAVVDLDAPRLRLVSTKAKDRQKETGEEAGKGIEDLAPFLLDRMQVKDGELLWIDAREPERPALRIHGIEGTLENFASRKALAKNEPTVLAMRGTLQKTGKVSVFATADPLAKKLTFAGQGRVEGLRLVELRSLLATKSDVSPDEGALDMNIRFEAKDGILRGGIRPIVKGGELRASEEGLKPKVKELIGNAALNIFSDDVPGRDAVATTIPIRGRVDDPEAQAVPTIVGILRNAFVRGLEDGLSGLPPPTAKQKENTLEQARRAFSPKRSAQPRAQPSDGK
jgi:hypothetical protein